MMGMRMPETCWALSKWQVINLRSCCILLVDSVEKTVWLLTNDYHDTRNDIISLHCYTVVMKERFFETSQTIYRQHGAMHQKTKLLTFTASGLSHLWNLRVVWCEYDMIWYVDSHFRHSTVHTVRKYKCTVLRKIFETTGAEILGLLECYITGHTAIYKGHIFYHCSGVNPLNVELNPIYYLLALLGAHNFLHVSRIRGNH